VHGFVSWQIGSILKEQAGGPLLVRDDFLTIAQNHGHTVQEY
jgi:hypothetical protein